MVSSCGLLLDEFELISQKAFVPDFLSALFQESDRVQFRDEENEVDIVHYKAGRDSVLRRLDLMGCTESLGERRFQEWRKATIRYYRDWKEEFNDDSDTDETLKALQELGWKEWRRRVPEVLRPQYDLENYKNHVDEIDRNMKGGDPSWLWFDGYDSLLSLCSIVAACCDTKTITLDIEPLVGGGWIGPDEKLCADKTRIVPTRGQPVGPTIILAEGRSDIEILKGSIERFHPDLVDYLTFLDHSEFRVDGGASYVVKFLKAFAAASVPANIVAVFDNDAAGRMAIKDAIALNLPKNMACVHLPDIDLGRSYPTIGPQGFHKTDINGKACGIELYLGKEALTSNGNLRPVRWTGYNKQAGTYQGEVDEKNDVQQIFLAKMCEEPVDLSNSYPEMILVWKTILSAATQVAEASQMFARVPRRW